MANFVYKKAKESMLSGEMNSYQLYQPQQKNIEVQL